MFETVSKTKLRLDFPSLVSKTGISVSSRDTGFMDWDVRSGRTTWNKTWTQLFGLPKGIYYGDAGMWEKSIHADYLPEVIESLNDHLSGKTRYFDSEYRLEHHCGKSHSIRTFGITVDRNSMGRPTRVILISQKIIPVSVKNKFSENSEISDIQFRTNAGISDLDTV